MLGPSGDGLITKLTSYLTSDKPAAPEAPPPTPSGDEGSYSSFLSLATDDSRDEAGRMNANKCWKTAPRHSLKRSTSELVIPSQVRNERSTATATLSAIRFKDDERHLQHAVPSAPHTSSPLTRTKPVPTRPTTIRSESESYLAEAFGDPKTRGREFPLKPCIKQKAKSAATTPPTGLIQDMTDIERRTLRRVKTVDFEESGSRSCILLPQVDVAPASATGSFMYGVETMSTPTSKPEKFVEKSPSCPNTISIVKSSVAGPAVTRTDVHVIAIAPAWNAQDVTNDDGANPATPTMQRIETKSGSYEVIWDDIPSEHNIRTRGRRSSSESHSLETVSPGARCGLERVNSKLVGWSGTWNSPSKGFKSTIVVFPDDDGCATHYDCAVGDEEDWTLLVPPNSQMTSVTSSRHASRPTSAPMTRTVSREETSSHSASHGTQPQDFQDVLQPPEQFLVVPRPGVQPGDGKAKQAVPVIVRQLSNLEEADMRFSGHRDSVTTAHSRLAHPGRVSPELRERRDSVAVARKQIHNRNRAARV